MKTTLNGSAEAPIQISTLPPVVGIDFDNSYASIAVFTKEGLAECIANKDGECNVSVPITLIPYLIHPLSRRYISVQLVHVPYSRITYCYFT